MEFFHCFVLIVHPQGRFLWHKNHISEQCNYTYKKNHIAKQLRNWEKTSKFSKLKKVPGKKLELVQNCIESSLKVLQHVTWFRAVVRTGIIGAIAPVNFEEEAQAIPVDQESINIPTPVHWNL